MPKRKKPNLSKALRKVDLAPDKMFGSVDVDLESLPILNKPSKEKITGNFDADLLKEIRIFARKNNVSYTNLMNDVLRKVFIDNDKAG